MKRKGEHITQLYSIQAVEYEEYRVEMGDQQTNVGPAIIQLLIEVSTCDKLHLLLTEFKNLFMESKSLPPQRPFDHSIHLKPNIEPVNIRSYCYAPIQKTEIENQVKEMLANSIIQPS